MQAAKDAHLFDDGVVDLRGQSITVEPGFPRDLETDQPSGVALQVRCALRVDAGGSICRVRGSGR